MANQAMAQPISFALPLAKLKDLEFLIGESSGLETIYPPGSTPVQFKASLVGCWESCERFFKLDFFGDIPGIGVETFRALITYSESKECYRMWAFAASQEEPMHFLGNFEDGALIFLGDPSPMVWGLQRLRFTIKHCSDGSIDLLGERWEPDGYAKYCSALFRPNSDELC
jgi:hypothetical protein